MSNRSVRIFFLSTIGLFVGFGLCKQTYAQTVIKTWKTIDELSAEERAELDFLVETPRDPRIPYLPAEAYPFSPPYTAEELGYLAENGDRRSPAQRVARSGDRPQRDECS
jgi:hypothetical protein